MKKIILFSMIFSFSVLYAQGNSFSPFLSIGRASDNDAVGDFAGGGGGLQVWDIGPIFRLGADYKLNKSFYAQGFVSYSYYKYDGSRSRGEKYSVGYNNMLDITGAVKWKIGIFYLNFGAGVSHQFSDDIRYLEETEYHKRDIFIHAKNKTVFAGQFALGFDIHVYERFSLLAEGDLFFREYLGSAWLLGVKYSFD